MSGQAVDVHEWLLRCPGCPTMVTVEWSDGNGAVWMDPKVRCANPMCDHEGPLTFVEDADNDSN